MEDAGSIMTAAEYNTGVLSTYTRSWLTESEQATPMVKIKDVVSEFDKHLKKAGGHIDRNVMNITVKTIIRKPCSYLA